MNHPVHMGDVVMYLRQCGVGACPLPGEERAPVSIMTIRLAESSGLLMADAQRRRVMQ